MATQCLLFFSGLKFHKQWYQHTRISFPWYNHTSDLGQKVGRYKGKCCQLAPNLLAFGCQYMYLTSCNIATTWPHASSLRWSIMLTTGCFAVLWKRGKVTSIPCLLMNLIYSCDTSYFIYLFCMYTTQRCLFVLYALAGLVFSWMTVSFIIINELHSNQVYCTMMVHSVWMWTVWSVTCGLCFSLSSETTKTHHGC